MNVVNFAIYTVIAIVLVAASMVATMDANDPAQSISWGKSFIRFMDEIGGWIILSVSLLLAVTSHI
ncbi:MAG TPA: hypothetical protein PLK89_16465 [Acidobacteriota bacterium]|nr:hypothetical protein [Acidobacteriota bacterium]